MNNKELTELIGSYYLSKITKKIHPSMIIKRHSQYGYIKSISTEVKNRELDITPLLHYDKFDDNILMFSETMKERLPHCNLKAFYNNLKTLVIEETDKIDTKKGQVRESGVYLSKKNKIKIYPPNIKCGTTDQYDEKLAQVVTHELLHLSSTYKKGPIVLCGFSQTIDRRISTGHGLNEGYTEVINSRYFCSKKRKIAYPLQYVIALGIEEIIGREKMEQLYFNADLNGLVAELSNYVELKSIHKLLKIIDQCHKYDGVNKNKYEEKATEARVIIANIQRVKDQNLFYEGKITEEEYNFRSFKSYCYVKGHKFIKYKDNYGMGIAKHKTGKTIPKEGYDIIIEKFIKSGVIDRLFTIEDANNAHDDLVSLGYCINNIVYRDKHDLSTIENIEVTESGYKLFTKDKKEIVSEYDSKGELDMMFEEPKTNDSSTPKSTKK